MSKHDRNPKDNAAAPKKASNLQEKHVIILKLVEGDILFENLMFKNH